MNSILSIIGAAIFGVVFIPFKAPTSAPSAPQPSDFNNVVWMSHFDGADGATSAIDSSSYGQSMTFNAGAALSTTQQKFGSASLNTSSASSRVSLTGSSAFDFGLGDFVIEMWVRFSADSRYCLFDYASVNEFALYLTTSTGYTELYDSGFGFLINTSGAHALSLNQWYHVVVSRSGSDFYVLVDGALFASASGFGSLVVGTSSSGFVLGAAGNGASNVDGYIDDVRVVKGESFYGTSFPVVVPSSAHPDFTGVPLLFAFDGSDGSATMTNNGQIALITATAGGSAQLDTAQSKWGVSSLLLAGDPDQLTITNNELLQFRDGDFTLEWWQYWDNLTGYQTIYSHGYVSAGALLLQTGLGDGRYIVYVNGSALFTESSSSPSTGQWYFYQLVRESGVFTLYRDGVSAGSASSGVSLSSATSPELGGAGGLYSIKGWVDDFRISKGIVRPSTVPTGAFPTF